MAEESLKYQTKKGLYWKMLDQFSGYGMQFIVGIVMARLLSPSDYGITALPAVFISIAGTITACGFNNAMVRKPDLNDSDLSTAFYYSSAVGVLCYIALFFASPYIADFYNTPVLKSLMRVTALTFLWGALSTPQNVIMNKNLDFKTITRNRVICKVFSGACGISLAFMGYGLWALVVTGVMTSVLSTFLDWISVRWLPNANFSKESFKYLWGYGNKIMASSFLDTIYGNITPVFIGKYYSPADLGVFNRANGYANLPSQNLTSVLRSVTFPVLSQKQDDAEALRRIYRKMLQVSAFIVFPIMMMLSVLAYPLVITMITAKWESCVVLLQILCFTSMWYPIHVLNLNLLQVKGRSDLFLRLEIIKKILGLGILAATLPFGLKIFCIGTFVDSMICLFINTYYTGKLIDLGYYKQLRDLLPTLLLSILMYAVVYITIMFIENMFLQIIIGGTIGCLVYILGAYIFKFAELNEVVYLLKIKRK